MHTILTKTNLYFLTEMHKQSDTPSMQGTHIQRQNKQEQATDSLRLGAREQRHNRPETIKHRAEMGPLVRDIYIIEKDFEGNGGSSLPRKHTQAACFPFGHAK